MTGEVRITHAELTADRDAQAARLRATRISYDQVAEQLGYADGSGAWRAVQRARARSVREPTQDMVLMDLAELDEMAQEAWSVLRATHYVVDRGGVVHFEGKPLRDDAPVLAAIAKLLDIQVRRARLVGLDQPAKATITHARADVDAAVAELVEVMRAAGDAGGH